MSERASERVSECEFEMTTYLLEQRVERQSVCVVGRDGSAHRRVQRESPLTDCQRGQREDLAHLAPSLTYFLLKRRGGFSPLEEHPDYAPSYFTTADTGIPPLTEESNPGIDLFRSPT